MPRRQDNRPWKAAVQAIKRQAAEERQAARDSRAAQDQLFLLDEKYGIGVGAAKERKRLQKLKEKK